MVSGWPPGRPGQPTPQNRPADPPKPAGRPPNQIRPADRPNPAGPSEKSGRPPGRPRPKSGRAAGQIRPATRPADPASRSADPASRSADPASRAAGGLGRLELRPARMWPAAGRVSIQRRGRARAAQPSAGPQGGRLAGTRRHGRPPGQPPAIYGPASIRAGPARRPRGCASGLYQVATQSPPLQPAGRLVGRVWTHSGSPEVGRSAGVWRTSKMMPP